MDIDLRTLTTKRGFKIFGAGGDIQSSYGVSGIGDINNDGFDDIIIGFANASSPGRTNAGISYVVFGKAAGFSDVDLTVLNLTTGFKVIGAAGVEANPPGDWSGFSVSGAGDINKDGFGDIIIGAFYASPFGREAAGETYVIFGNGIGFQDIDLVALAMPIGFKILGTKSGSQSSDYSGYSVSGAGDVNKDGFDDIIIGAWRASPLERPNAGISYVIFGKATGFSDIDLAALSLPNGFRIIGESGQSGNSVSSAGDINGDGFADIIIGANMASPLNRINAGTSYVIFGKAEGFEDIDLLTLSGLYGFKILGAKDGDRTGFAVSGAGDINKDGFDDIIIGTYNTAITYVIFGRGVGFADVDLATVSIPIGFRIIGIGDGSGYSVKKAGDVDGDRFDDIIIGAPIASPLNRIQAGASYILFGKATGFSDLDLPTSADLRIIGGKSADQSGSSVSGGFDINGDGFSDIVIKAPTASPLNRTQAGESYVIYGSRTFNPTFTPTPVPLTHTPPTLIPVKTYTPTPEHVKTHIPTHVPTPIAYITHTPTLIPMKTYTSTPHVKTYTPTHAPEPVPVPETPSAPEPGSKLPAIIGGIAGGIAAVCIGFGAYKYYHHRKKLLGGGFGEATPLSTQHAFGGELGTASILSDRDNWTNDIDSLLKSIHAYSQDPFISSIVFKASQIMAESNTTIIFADNIASGYNPVSAIIAIRQNAITENSYTSSKAILMHELTHMIFHSISSEVNERILSHVYHDTMLAMLSYAAKLLGFSDTEDGNVNKLMEALSGETYLNLFYLNSNIYNTVKHEAEECIIDALEKQCTLDSEREFQTLEQREYALLEQCMPKVVATQDLNAEEIYFLERVADHVNGIQKGVYLEGASGAEELVARCVEMKAAGVSEHLLGVCDAVWETFKHIT